MRSAWALIRCSHPEPVLAVTAAAVILAISAGRGAGTLLAAAAILSGQLFIGWTNDYHDRDLDRAAGRRDKPIVAGEVDQRTVRTAAIVVGLACVPLSFANGAAAGALHLAAVAIALLYNLALKSTPLSVVPYLLAFGSVPAFITLGLPHPHLPPAWVLLGAALLGAGGHFTQVLPDIEDDRRQGIRGLPQLLGVRASAVAAALLLAGSAFVILLGPGHPGELQLVGLGLVLLAALGIVGTALADRRRLSFRLTLVAAAGIAALFLVSGRALA